MHFFRDSGVSSVLESSFTPRKLRFSGRCFLALTQKLLFLEVPISIILALLFFNVNCAQAFQGDINPSNVKFKRVLAEHDIALGAIYDVVQDSQGFIWIGGMGGLVRYDGYTLKIVGQSGDANNAIKRVHDIYEDQQNNLWLATSYGLIQYNMLTEEHVRYTEKIAGKSSEITLSNNYVMKVTGSPSGEILAATWAGINVISPDHSRVSVVYPDNNNPASHPVMALQFDANKRLWVGTSQGVYYQNWVSKEFTKVTSKSAMDKAEIKAFAMADNHLWVGSNKGLYQLAITHTNDQSPKVIAYRHDAKKNDSLSADLIWSLLLDKQGLLWIATDQGGLNLFDAQTQGFIHYKNNAASPTSLVTNTVKALLQDNNGDIWTGHFPTGVNYFNRSTTVATLYVPNPMTEGSLSHNSVMAFAEDGNNNIWVGTDGGGLNVLNARTGRFDVFKHNSQDNSLQSNAVLALLNTDNQTLWVGTWGGGLASMDLQSQKVTRHTLARNEDGSAKKLSVWSLYLDSDKNLWVGTQFNGLYRYQPSTKTVKHYAPSAASDSLAANEVWTMLEDKRGNFWVGTSAGLNLMDRKAGTFSAYKNVPNDVNSLSQNSVESLFEDGFGQLWVGTAGGLNLWRPAKQNFKRFTKADGLVDDVVKSLMQDAAGVLWLGTSNGLSTIDPKTHELKNYRPHIGWQKGAFNANAAWLTRSNTLMLGGENGFMAFSPKGLEKSAYQAPIVFTDLRLDAKPVVVARGSSFNRTISFESQITINNDLQMFAIDFSLLSYRSSRKNQYAYRLKGFDKAWREVGVQHSATYTNLPKGVYSLEVRAANHEGRWNAQAARLDVLVQ